MNSVIIFNFNYAQFITKALASCSPIFNRDDFQIIIADDGSSDDSVNLVEAFIRRGNVQNISIQRTRPFNAGGRRFPSHGQMAGIEMFLTGRGVKTEGYVFFLDADDYYDFNIVDFYDTHLHKTDLDIGFLAVHDLSLAQDELKKIKVTRFASPGSSMMWPSIVPTSGLLIRRSQIDRYAASLLSYDRTISDVWIDARVNILALHHNIKSKYFNERVIRQIHTANDSTSGGKTRMLLKQISTLRFRGYLDELEACKNNFRYFATACLSFLYYTIDRRRKVVKERKVEVNKEE